MLKRRHNKPASRDNVGMEPLSLDIKEKILNYSVPWPECSYIKHSKRLKQKSSKENCVSGQLYKLIQSLHHASTALEIAIDGMNGVGKTALCKMMRNRKYCKINNCAQDITKGSEYNFNPIRSLEYLTFSALTKPKRAIIWDRTSISNMVFSFVHYIMSVYRDTDIPADPTEVYSKFNDFALNTGFFNTVAYLKSIKNIPTIFLVCSDLKLVTQAMFDRGTISDVYNSTHFNYQIAQLHAYTYVGNCIGATIIDIAKCVIMTETRRKMIYDPLITLGDLQLLLVDNLDYYQPPQPTENELEDFIEPPDRTSASIVNRFSSYQDTMLYTYSSK
uniref:GrBNV_gp34-like protein n=1 Tax=Nilaparvata lugens endogenous nudivirus TaxID=1487700 RepID=X5GWA9_9VIRU|nr:GrBNV_gp34-like protein [Nilaparvata lugens endogenous nudivirus]